MQHFETAVTTNSQTTDKATIALSKKGSVKTIDAATEALDITSLFALGNTKSLSLRPSDKKVQDKEVEALLKAGDALSVKNEMYHKQYVVRGNQALYELLSEIYGLALQINMSVSKMNILEAMRAKLKARNIKTQYNTPVMTTVIKYVVGSDRQTAANYSRVLTIAMDENLAPNELATYISRRGGISQIHGTEVNETAKKLGEKENKERLDILREYYALNQYIADESIKFDGTVLQHNFEKQGKAETATFCFFMTVYDEQADEYRVISAHDLGKTYEDALLRVLFKGATNDLNKLRHGLRRFEEKLIVDTKAPKGLVDKLQAKHKKQDADQATLVEAEELNLLEV
jgi:hypothetical protein